MLSDRSSRAAAPARGACARASLGLLSLVVALVASLVAPAPVPAPLEAILTSTGDAAADERQFFDLLNGARAANGKPKLVLNAKLSDSSRSWSASMRSSGTLAHDPNLTTAVSKIVPGWTRAGENVGVGYSVQSLHDAFYASSGHRANMLGAYNQVGVGVVFGTDGKLWVTFRFVQGPLPVVRDAVGVHRPNAFLLRSSLSAGTPTTTFEYGSTSDIAVMGDWNGDGIATPGVYRQGTWYLRNSNSAGAASIAFSYGGPGDRPVVGDWDGNGTDTVGVRSGNVFKLRNHNSAGRPFAAFAYGNSAAVPLVGDWDGNRTDTIGVRNSNVFKLRNHNSGGAAHITVAYGTATDVPVVGDWDGNRTDTLGVRRGSTFLLRNANTGGPASLKFSYGSTTDRPLIGAWG